MNFSRLWILSIALFVVQAANIPNAISNEQQFNTAYGACMYYCKRAGGPPPDLIQGGPVGQIPENLLYNYYKLQEQELQIPYEQFKQQSHENFNRIDIERIAEYVHSHFPEYTKEQFDSDSGMKQWRGDNRTAWDLFIECHSICKELGC